MICKHCGAVVEDGKKFCGDCGAPVEAEPVRPEPVVVKPVARAVDTEKNSDARTVMILGILGLAIGNMYSAVAGIILSAIGRKKAKEYEENYGPLTGKAKVGGILSLVGLILNIITVAATVLAVIVILAIYGLAIWAIIVAIGAGGEIDLSKLQEIFNYIPFLM